MKVVQVVSGKFHHFHLARYLHQQGNLEAIFTGYPWFKLCDEGLPRDKVRSYPWFAGSYMAARRIPGMMRIPGVERQWEWLTQTMIAHHAARSLPQCDAVVAISGTGLEVGRRIQLLGGKYLCDRGSSHIRFQDRILKEEYERWGFRWRGVDPRILDREEAEYATADAITVPSTFAFNSFVSLGVPAAKMRLIPYGADVARFKPVARPNSDDFIVLFVGNLSLQKGAPYLFDAFRQFKHSRKSLWIVGSQSIESLQLLNRRKDVIPRFLGHVNNRELAEIYSQAHVLVLPSVQEGLAMVQGEALACGCPVIASTNTGAADLFTDGREGFIVPIRDPDAIADRLARLADDPSLREQMSQAAVARVRDLGGWDEYGGNYRETITRLAASTPRSGAQIDERRSLSLKITPASEDAVD